MATATSLGGRGRLNAWDSIAASATDSVLVTGITGKKIRVISYVLNQGDTTPSSVTFNTKGAGAGTAIGPAWKAAANGGFVVGEIPGGWFETLVGQSLTVTTGAGSTTGVLVVYELINP